jgi:hypothetical protein
MRGAVLAQAVPRMPSRLGPTTPDITWRVSQQPLNSTAKPTALPITRAEAQAPPPGRAAAAARARQPQVAGLHSPAAEGTRNSIRL